MSPNPNMVQKQNPPSQAKHHSSSLSLYLNSTAPTSQSMETIENIAADQNYCEMTKMFSNDELKSWTMHQAFTQSYEYSSSPEGAASTASKTIVSERKRRKKLNDKLLELRGAVPKISKLDKASTLKDAIVYIQDLQEQERRLQAEIMELESKSLKKDPGFDFEQELPVLLRPKKTRYDQIYDHRAPISYPIKVHELRVNSMGEKTLLVSLTCSKARDAMIKICEIFESMKLKIITANVAIVSGMVKKTVLIETWKRKIILK
ncbi:transcription factor bHLH35 isoform X2 [Populus trichocarpa]|uniref:transcription factor bHLH35 isoform X2 n=1 Tax=Populus trichocarpa TaxID=3694 RepID=UPI0022781EB3|nr:transcription factor bHLH35 isoform X2 [Populus trichocarpa]